MYGTDPENIRPDDGKDTGNGCIFLIGFMGSGKSKVGRVLAQMLGAAYLDTDEMIEEREGISVSRIFEQYGEPYFRDLETRALEELKRNLPGERVVVSVGGGLPVREENRALMRRAGKVVFLTADEETLVGRLSGSKDRPLLQGVDLRERIRSLSAARQALYLDAADFKVATDGKTPEEIAQEIIRVTGIKAWAFIRIRSGKAADHKGKEQMMLRDESIGEISDGRFYGPNDMVKADTGSCSGCSLCCHGMEDTLLLEPPDIYRFRKELNLTFEQLIAGPAQLGMADGLILPHLRMKEDEACAFLDQNGRCRIHRARPAYCRMFPLGRYYQGDDFVYILQIHQCDHPRTKVKVKKWIDLPDLPAYEAFARDWHALLHRAGEIADREADEGMRKAICMVILRRFYQHPWDVETGFYPQYEAQAAQARQDLGIAAGQ